MKKIIDYFRKFKAVILKIVMCKTAGKNDTNYILSPTCQISNLDKIYKQYFSFRRNGTFVEVGAQDGEYSSNTSCLADADWSGFYIEPVPEYFELCKKRHAKNKRVKVFRKAISESNGVETLFIGGPLSTMDPKMLDLFASFDWAKGHHKGIR